jgi:hypothetical protein
MEYIFYVIIFRDALLKEISLQSIIKKGNIIRKKKKKK